MKCYNCNKELEIEKMKYVAGNFGFCYACVDNVNNNIKTKRKPKQPKKISTCNKKDNKNIVDNYKLQHGCAKCGYNTCVSALHLHHNEPKDKTSDISRMIKQKYSLNRIMSEIQKCIVVCANCHAELHALERESPPAYLG